MSNNENNGTKQKIAAQIILWLLGIVFLAGVGWASFETKSSAQDSYVRKEVFQEFKENSNRQNEQILKALERIEKKIDQKQDKKGE